MSAKDRKDRPIARGVLNYFPDALAEVAYISKIGNDQHNPGQPMHWAKEKSTDHADCIIRHLIDSGKFDSDGTRHSAKVAWRALALLQIELDEEAKKKEKPRENIASFRTDDKALYDKRREWLITNGIEYECYQDDNLHWVVVPFNITIEQFRELELVY